MNINTKYDNTVSHQRILPTKRETFLMVLTFFLSVIGWIIFRAESMTQAYGYFHSMLTNRLFDYSMMVGKKALILGIVLMLIEWFQRNKQHALQIEDYKLFNSRYMRWGVYYAILISLYYNSTSGQTFIYFQF